MTLNFFLAWALIFKGLSRGKYDYVVKEKPESPQFLQIIINKKPFDSLGYYSYVGGSPIFTVGSADFIDQIQSSKILSKINDFNDLTITEALSKTLQNANINHQFYKHVNPSFWKETITNLPLKLLQVRFLSTNPSFYNKNIVNFNEFYANEDDFIVANNLRKNLKDIFDQSSLISLKTGK